MLENLINKTKCGLAGLIMLTSLSGCASLRTPSYERVKQNEYATESYVKEANDYLIVNKQIVDDAKKEEGVTYGPANMVEIWW